jgi:phosphomannomutase
MEVMSEELISAYDIRGNEATGLNVECAWNVGKALADWLPTNGTVLVVGRPAQAELAQAVIEGLRLQGRAVIDGGELDKEQVVKRIKQAHLSGAVIIGFDDLAGMTTIELYQNEGRLVTNETGLTTVRNLVEAGNFVPAAIKGELVSR